MVGVIEHNRFYSDVAQRINVTRYPGYILVFDGVHVGIIVGKCSVRIRWLGKFDICGAAAAAAADGRCVEMESSIDRIVLDAQEQATVHVYIPAGQQQKQR